MSDITYTLTKEELYRGLWRARRPLPRLILTSAVLLLLGVPSLVGACLGKGDSGIWLLGVALPILAALQWILPALMFRREAATLAAEAKAITLTLGEETLAAGGVTVPLQHLCLEQAGELLIWRVDKTQSVLIPRRVLTEAQWQTLQSLV